MWRGWGLLFFILFLLCRACWAAESMSSEEISARADQIMRDMIELSTECGLVGLTVYVQNGQAAGLSKESVETAARSRLRSARLYNDSPGEVGGVLRIQVLLVPERKAYTYRVWFEKQQIDKESGIHDWSPSGWEKWRVGEHAGNSNAILSGISQGLDQFLDDYLRVNDAGVCETSSAEDDGLTKIDYDPFADQSEQRSSHE